jgi:uncharacterized hydrophobic protein (TIGR00271 family)
VLAAGSVVVPAQRDGQNGDAMEQAGVHGYQLTGNDVDRMVDKLLFVGPGLARKRSAFWVLLTLAAIIAAAGVVSDSTATVIGAMIVAPLMTPILGTALALVLARKGAMVRSLGYVVGGALLVVAVGYLLGAIDPVGVSETNSQVTGRINPRLIDLIAALATGTVGAFALVRSDVSDTLPGVAIAISLVPPLAVVGLLLEVGRYDDALGAFLLFGTNVTAIIATGTAVLLLYRVRDVARTTGAEVGVLRGRALAAVAALIVLVAVPLYVGTARVIADRIAEAAATPIATAWADARGWRVVSLEVRDGTIRLVALGPPPEVDPETLRAELDTAGLDLDLVISLVVGGQRELPAERPARPG